MSTALGVSSSSRFVDGAASAVKHRPKSYNERTYLVVFCCLGPLRSNYSLQNSQPLLQRQLIKLLCQQQLLLLGIQTLLLLLCLYGLILCQLRRRELATLSLIQLIQLLHLFDYVV